MGCESGFHPLKSPDHGDALGVRRPHREVGSLLAIDLDQVRAELLEQPIVVAFVEKMKIVAGQQRGILFLETPWLPSFVLLAWLRQ